jgi:hypothetical protein
VVHYTVYFSVAAGRDTDPILAQVRAFLTDLRDRGLVTSFALRRNGNSGSKTKLLPFQAQVSFDSYEKMAEPFKLIAAEGIRNGAHGALLEGVPEIAVEVFEDLEA